MNHEVYLRQLGLQRRKRDYSLFAISAVKTSPANDHDLSTTIAAILLPKAMIQFQLRGLGDQVCFKL
jgi:hypothetical protein